MRKKILLITITYILFIALLIALLLVCFDNVELISIVVSSISALGTIGLGILSLYQNKLFDTENEKAQKRLEQINEKTNNLSIVNKIIELEVKKHDSLQESFDYFIRVSDLDYILSELRMIRDSNLQYAKLNLFIINTEQCYLSIKRELNNGRDSNENLLMVIVNDLYKNIDEAFNEMLYGKAPSDKVSENISECRKELIFQSENYIQFHKEKIRKLLYENLAFDEIKNMF